MCNVWDSAHVLSAIRRKELGDGSATRHGHRNVKACAGVETVRYECVQKMRRHLSEQCCRYGLPDAPSGLSEGFHFTWLSSCSAGDSDPLFPGLEAWPATDPLPNGLGDFLKNELVKAGMQNEDILSGIVWEMGKICRKIRSALSLAKRKQKCNNSKPEQRDIGEKGINFVYKGLAVRISHQHYQKLCDLVRLTCNESMMLEDLNEAIFCVLLRYKSLQGGGFQAAIAPGVFDVLKSDLGVEMECFASPLNSRYSTFCSAFPDTDALFGSLGSFFDFHPAHGSFELNPPFVHELIDRMAGHCEALLVAAESAKLPLSFVIIVGASIAAQKHPSWQRLSGSTFNQSDAQLLLKVNEHRYIDGRQHYGRAGLVSTTDTGIFFWQTSAAAARWPVSASVRARIAAAFRATAPAPPQTPAGPAVAAPAPPAGPVTVPASPPAESPSPAATQPRRHLVKRTRGETEGGEGGEGGDAAAAAAAEGDSLGIRPPGGGGGEKARRRAEESERRARVAAFRLQRKAARLEGRRRFARGSAGLGPATAAAARAEN